MSLRPACEGGEKGRRSHLLPALGCALLLMFFGLTQSTVGLEVKFPSNWANSSKGELYFWCAYMALVVPGALCIALHASRALRLSGNGFPELLSRPWNQALLFGGLALVLARLGNAHVLLGYPCTDDENGARLGGQILGLGRTMMPVPAWWELSPKQYLFTRSGLYGSFDWLGAQALWALALSTGLGPLLFAFLAALPVGWTAALLCARFGATWGLVGGTILLLSPMSLLLSFTTHAHLGSRAAVAACLWFLWRADLRPAWTTWSLGGMALGLGLLCRPFEVGFLLLPLLLATLWRTWQRLRAAAWPCFAGFLLVLLVIGCLFLWHNRAVTGHAWLPARLAENDIGLAPDDEHHRAPLAFLHEPALLWERFGANSAYNALMLAIFFLGPLGLAAVVLGARRDWFTRSLSVGVLLVLGLALFHDDYGVHIVGPIHCSEAVVPLACLAVCGLQRATRRLAVLGTPARFTLPALAIFLAISLGIFDAWQARALHGQARIHASIYGLTDDARFDDSVVLVPPYHQVWSHVPEFAGLQSFVFAWRRAHPLALERVLYLHDLPGAEALLRRVLPERTRYRLQLARNGALELLPLGASMPARAVSVPPGS